MKLTLTDRDGRSVEVTDGGKPLNVAKLDWDNPNLTGVRLGRLVHEAVRQLEAKKKEEEEAGPPECGNCGDEYDPSFSDYHGFCSAHCYRQSRGETCPAGEGCSFCEGN